VGLNFQERVEEDHQKRKETMVMTKGEFYKRSHTRTQCVREIFRELKPLILSILSLTIHF
jgi:hypothetical protein